MFVRRLLASAIAAAAMASTLVIPPVLAQSPTEHSRQRWNIPAGSLEDALSAFAAAAAVPLSFEPALVAGKRSNGLQGEFSADEGFDRLLQGSGLQRVRADDGTYSLRRAPEGAVTLAAVKVNASVDRPLPGRQELGYRNKSSAVSGFREQEVLNTPFSTTTISAEVIEDQQAKSLIEVLKNDPSVTPASNPLWYDRVNVRGFLLSVDAIYRDGMSINDQGSIALENKAAVEVNKGLAALRYGATSPGGTINYVVKRPTEEALRKITLSGDGYGSAGLHADLGGRLGESQQLGYRINAAGEELRNHIDVFEGDKKFVSGFFEWVVNDRISLELDLEHQRMEKLNVDDPAIRWWATTALARDAFHRLDPDTYVYQDWAEEPNEQTYIATRVNYELNQDWKAIIAAQDSQLWRDQDAAGVYSTINASGEYGASIYYSPDQERDNRAYQLVFQGDVRTGGVLHELAFGYDSVRRDMTWSDGVYTDIGTDNLFNPRGVARPPVGPADAGESILRDRTQQNAWFATDNVILSEQWRVFGGWRQTQIRQYGSVATQLKKMYDETAVTPTLGLVYKPVPKGTLYVSYAEGIEQGGVVNGAGYTNNGDVFAPLKSEQYEAGVKWEVGNDTLITAALFEIDKGLEIDRDNGDGTRTRVQDGRQVHGGLELTASGAVTDRLRVIAGVAYLDAEIEKTDNVALIGKRPQGVPEWQANLYADYSLDRYVAGLSLNGSLYYSDEKSIDRLNTWMADSFVRMDVGMRYLQTLSSRQAITYRLNIDNLADEEYLANTTSGTLEFGEPRTVKASMTYAF